MSGSQAGLFDVLLRVTPTWLCRVTLCLLAGAATSCGQQAEPARLAAFPVTGKVYLNQKPLIRALVVFHPINPPDGPAFRGYAQTTADGSFSLSTFLPHDGAPVGKYKVTVHLQDEDNGPGRVPPGYGQVETTGIIVEVKAQTNTLPTFHLRPL